MSSRILLIIKLLSGPLIFLLCLLAAEIHEDHHDIYRVAGIAGWMILWWMLEAVPMAITALLPMILFPVMKVSSMEETARNFANPTIFLFMGGFMLALAMERSNLHKRIAFTILGVTGNHANGIILGFFLTTAFLSMWVSNTATTMMMIPIGLSVIRLLEEHYTEENMRRPFRNFALCLTLGIAYSATIGGIGTVIGSPPNVVTKAYIESLTGQTLSFSSWMIIGVPVMILLLAFSYFHLVFVIYPNSLGRISRVSELLQGMKQGLGPMRKDEKAVAVIFTLTAIGWIFGGLLNNMLGRKIFDDTIVALCGGLLMFTFPVSLREKKFLLEWQDVRNLPWDILLLFGGGLSLAHGMERSGIMEIISQTLNGTGIPHIWMLLLIIMLVLMLSEVMSNVALAGIFVPVAISVAEQSGQPVMVYAITCGIATSYGFMMPVATPPNAIVYGTGYIRIPEMMKAGFWLNIAAILITWLMILLLGDYLN